MSDAVSGTGPREYGLPTALRARLWGVTLAAIGVVLVVTTLVVALVDVPSFVLTVLVVFAALDILVLGSLLIRKWYVVRLDDTGYRIRFVRGAGAQHARWTDVEDLTTAVVSGADCVVLRLRDGRTTTIPVDLIEGDREAFVDELRQRLDAGHGYRKL